MVYYINSNIHIICVLFIHTHAHTHIYIRISAYILAKGRNYTASDFVGDRHGWMDLLLLDAG